MERIRPETEEELAEAVRGAEGPLRIVGGGTRGVDCRDDLPELSAGGLSGITLYEPGALTLVVRAGTPLAEVEAVLAEEGQRLPFEPSDMRALMGTEGMPTIGGVVAANVSGPRRVQAGACRDSLIGVRFVDGRGDVIRSGGRVMKNVTGYDLVKLMAGSHGTLGVLTEVAFKVLPAAETVAQVEISGLSPARAVQVMAAALATPCEVSGAAWLSGTGRVLLRLEGFEASVDYRTQNLRLALADYGRAEIRADSAQVADMWRELRDVQPFAGRAGDVWRVIVKPTDAPLAAEALEAEEVILDWGGGLIWALMPEGTDARARLSGIAGHARLVRAGPETRGRIPAFAPEPEPVAALGAGLRRRFDPRGILNPGLMG